MSLIDEVIAELKIKHGYTKFEIEKIIDSQFKVLLESIQNKDLRTINVMHIGKWRPTYYLKKIINDKQVYKEGKGDISRMEESSVSDTRDRGVS